MKFQKILNEIQQHFNSSKNIRWVLLIGVTVIFSAILHPNLLITKHTYKIGDIAEKDIKAPRAFFIEDKAATDSKKRQELNKILPVFDHDMTTVTEIDRQIKHYFSLFRSQLVDSQQALGEPDSQNTPILPIERESSTPTTSRILLNTKVDFEKKTGLTLSDKAFDVLKKNRFSNEIANLLSMIMIKIFENGVTANKEGLLRFKKDGITVRFIPEENEKVEYNLKHYYGKKQAKAMVRIIGEPVLVNLNHASREVVVEIAQKAIVPNFKFNKKATDERKKMAANNVVPVLYQIKAGEMVLREGERLTEVHLFKLKALNEQVRESYKISTSIGAGLIIFLLLVITYVIHVNNRDLLTSKHNKNLLFVVSILLTFFILTQLSVSFTKSLSENAPFPISSSSMLFGIPLAAGAMTICLFMGLDIAILFTIVISTCITFLFQNNFEFFIYFLFNGTMGAYWIQDCRERKTFIKSGIKLGLINVIFATAIDLHLADYAGLKLLWDWAFAFLGGIGAGIITAGIAPLVEIAFDFKTNITLLELANLDQPILRKLLISAPGTYHHSVIVGSMVEAAASEIGANSLLAKVCGYYHDIGKIQKPLYFVENQTDGKNKHNKLAPSMSGLILISHVKHGVEIAKKYKLGKGIIDTIMQHHGTSIIQFFYEKAKQKKGEDTVNINHYRYPGPRPQTKEIALVMLADVVEAASRTLDNPTPSRINGLVQNLINKVFSDGQLDNCELTLKDLHNIAKSFNTILNGIHHHRIEYPEKTSANAGKEKDGRPDSQQTDETKDRSGKTPTNGKSHLRRLGNP